MTILNLLGHQVEALDNLMGWRQASVVFDTEQQAADAMAVWPIKGVELRVMDALQAAPLTGEQWINQWLKGCKSFVLRSLGLKARGV